MNLEAYHSQYRDERSAKTWCEEVAPLWDERFAQALLRHLPSLEQGTVLDIHCGHGFTSTAVLNRLPKAVKVLALQAESSLDTLAKAKIPGSKRNRIQFRPGNFDDVTVMPDQRFELALCNLVLGEAVPDWSSGLTELLRVVKNHGHVLASLVLRGTWREIDDIFAEVLQEQDLRSELAMLKKVQALRPTAHDLRHEVQNLGISPNDFWIEFSRFQILFRSGREFLYAPIIQQGPLELWRALLQKTASPQEIFKRLRETIDIYYRGHVLATTVVVGTLHIQKNGPGPKQDAIRQRHLQNAGEILAMLNSGAEPEENVHHTNALIGTDRHALYTEDNLSPPPARAQSGHNGANKKAKKVQKTVREQDIPAATPDKNDHD